MSDLNFTSFSGTSRPTAFAIHDSDEQFQADADKLVFYVQRTLGNTSVESELETRQIWTAFKQAALEYSQAVNANHARSTLLDLLGSSTGSLSGSEGILPLNNSIELARKYTMQYSSELGVGGPYAWYTGSVTTAVGTQKYDLWSAVSGALTGAFEGRSIVIRKIHHYEPTAAYRFFDTTSVMNYLGNSFKFESYSPETIFYLLPIWEDVLRGTQLSLNQRVRRSNYSFDLKGYELTLYPVPNKAESLNFEYTITNDPTGLVGSVSGSSTLHGHKAMGVVSNISNIAFGHIGYKNINSIGKNWIWRMTLGMCKEILGQIRNKYDTLPIPGGDIKLNGAQLLSEGREDQINLRLELKDLLEQMSYKNLMTEKTEMEETQRIAVSRVPLLIYVSK